MQYTAIHKVENGKMLRLRFEIKDDSIISFELRGDFFLYPENRLEDIEKFLIGMKINEINAKLSQFLKTENVETVGFAPVDLEVAVKNAVAPNN